VANNDISGHQWRRVGAAACAHAWRRALHSTLVVTLCHHGRRARDALQRAGCQRHGGSVLLVPPKLHYRFFEKNSNGSITVAAGQCQDDLAFLELEVTLVVMVIGAAGVAVVSQGLSGALMHSVRAPLTMTPSNGTDSSFIAHHHAPEVARR
jgi:hypothetical protein